MSGLDIGQKVELMLLERVHQGRITERYGCYFDSGQRIHRGRVRAAYSAWVEVGWLELHYPPGVHHRQRDCLPGELVKGVHFGLTEAELTRRVCLTEKGLAEYKRLAEQRGDAAAAVQAGG